jgi:hypothetical protein
MVEATIEFPSNEQDRLLLEGKRKYKHLHNAIFGEISSMLCKAKLEPIERLHGLDPSFSALVKELKQLREIVAILAPLFGFTDDLGMIDEYISLAEELASSIDAQNSDSLCAAISMLDDKPYV